jgi:hypothetical protein
MVEGFKPKLSVFVQRSNEPVSELYYQHRLTADDRELTKELVLRAVNRLIECRLIRVARVAATDMDRQRLLVANKEPEAPQIVSLKPIVAPRSRRALKL